ncbi:MAG: hypothetical protein LDLANPLL_01290 [Turneriella sp.]|nr:hypothetical protein [Turneriella sp.]
MPERPIVLSDKILDAVEKVVASNERLIVKAYGFIPVTEFFMRHFIKRVLTQFSRPELASAIAMLIKELTVNAAKANFKRLLFLENNLDVKNPADYERGMRLFREAISETMPFEYGTKAKQASLNVQTVFDFDADRIIIEVKNNLAMSKIEEMRVREKLRQAMDCKDISEFMMENVDETEGAGLGIILSLMALKSSSIDPHALSISTDFKNETIARVEIPLHENYIPKRLRPHDVVASV